MKLLWLLIIALVITGCSGELTDVIEASEGISLSSDGETVALEKDEEVFISTNDTREGIERPDWYPNDAFPLYEDFVLITTTRSDEGDIMVIGSSNTTLEQLVDFYLDQLSSAQTTLENATEESYINMGHVKGWDYNLTLHKADDEDYNTGFAVILVENSDFAGAESTASSIGHMTLPEDYPYGLLPFYSEEYQLVNVMVGESEKMLIFTLDASIEDTIVYYDQLLNGAEMYLSMASDDGHTVMGRLEDYSITVIIMEHYGQGDYLTEVQLVYIKE